MGAESSAQVQAAQQAQINAEQTQKTNLEEMSHHKHHK